MAIGLRYTARSEVRFVGDASAPPREVNLDSAYAGPHLLAVADGSAGARFRSHERALRITPKRAEIASATVVNSLGTLDIDVPGDQLLTALDHGVYRAGERLRLVVESDPLLQGAGTTLTATLWSGRYVALAHIGDSRAYLLRNGKLHQITHDHTYGQSLVDEGRITQDQAASHPESAALLRALDEADEVDAVDLSLREVMTGDRYLLCTHGLYRMVAEQKLQTVVSQAELPETAAQQLIDLANRWGNAHNITCVIADVVETGARSRWQEPIVAGAAAAGHSSPGAGAPPRRTPRAESAGTPTAPADFTLDGYQIFESLGEGGAATVYRARRTALGRDVAIKVIHRRITADRDLRRFRREIDAMVRLSEHPNVVTLYDADTLPDGRPFLVMELCPGGSLADRLRSEGPLPANQVRDIGIQVADALVAAHGQNVLHRDIKPGNLLLTRFRRVALADFGIAALPIPGQDLSVTLSMTPAYASPEVLAGDDPSVAGDIYSLGVTLYALLAGRPPYAPERDLSPVALIAYLLRAQDALLPDIPEAPRPLMAVVRQALHRDATRRFATAAQFRDALAGIAPK